jgi:hypothetical protein
MGRGSEKLGEASFRFLDLPPHPVMRAQTVLLYCSLIAVYE